MRISDWSSDVCSSDLAGAADARRSPPRQVHDACRSRHAGPRQGCGVPHRGAAAGTPRRRRADGVLRAERRLTGGTMTNNPLALPQRGGKPRRRGLTALIDFGPDEYGWTGAGGIENLLDCAADYIDYAKIYALNALLLDRKSTRLNSSL